MTVVKSVSDWLRDSATQLNLQPAPQDLTRPEASQPLPPKTPTIACLRAGAPTQNPSVCVGCLFFKDTEPSPLQVSSSVRQQGGLPGPPPRSPPSRIHRLPGVLPLTAQHYCLVGGARTQAGPRRKREENRTFHWRERAFVVGDPFIVKN